MYNKIVYQRYNTWIIYYMCIYIYIYVKIATNHLNVLQKEN